AIYRKLPRGTKRKRHPRNNYRHAHQARMDQDEGDESSHPISRTRRRDLALRRRLLAQPPLLLNAKMRRLRPKPKATHSPPLRGPFRKVGSPGTWWPPWT